MMASFSIATTAFLVAVALFSQANGVPVETVGASEVLKITAHRPSESTWKRTKCGSPSQHDKPPVPMGNYQTGVDYPGNDINKHCAKPFENGCIMDASSTYLDCEKSCNTTKGCVLYVFAPQSCDGQPGPVCWVKSAVGRAVHNAGCRDSRIMGQPGSNSTMTDIPTKWGSTVTASSTPLVAYPRPQMVRGTGDLKKLRDEGDASVWTNLNGLWEWESTSSDVPQFGQQLNGSILVPFPVESCLSGVAPNSSDFIVKQMWYRLVFDAERKSLAGGDGRTLLHFGAIDWQSTIYLNGEKLGNHTGGYDGFSYEVTLKPSGNELLVYAFDPSDQGSQPNGKQRISAISSPGGDTYTPSSGIWQTVWLEAVPSSYISEMTMDTSSTTLTVSVQVEGAQPSDDVTYQATDPATGAPLGAAVKGKSGQVVTIPFTGAETWSPEHPKLYDLKISTGTDSVLAYFGLRTIALGDGPKGKRPFLNGNFTFFAGFLDQSWWPDGQYTAPTDDALAYDIQVVPMFGLNMIRLHQKVNPERWYYHADTIGVAIFQDMIQKYGGASAATIPYFVSDLQAMIKGRGNHPSILQIETFNEGDCWEVFKNPPYDVKGIVDLAKKLAPTRLVDTDSGGGANNDKFGDVNDIHSYPYPGNPMPSSTQYAMVGEFGGIGAFVQDHMWTSNGCHTYLKVATPHDEATTYINMASTIKSNSDHISASVYTQTTDLENECDGFLNYDRTNKFSDDDTKAIMEANQAIIKGPSGL